MGFRFRKSIKIASGVRVNVGSKSVGVSAGVKGARISTNTRTGTRATVGIPGTGLSYSEKIGGAKRINQPNVAAPKFNATCPHCSAVNTLPVPDNLNTTFRCGRCKGNFHVENLFADDTPPQQAQLDWFEMADIFFSNGGILLVGGIGFVYLMLVVFVGLPFLLALFLWPLTVFFLIKSLFKTGTN